MSVDCKLIRFDVIASSFSLCHSRFLFTMKMYFVSYHEYCNSNTVLPNTESQLVSRTSAHFYLIIVRNDLKKKSEMFIYGFIVIANIFSFL